MCIMQMLRTIKKITLCCKAIDSDDGVPYGNITGGHDDIPADKITGVEMNLGTSYKGVGLDDDIPSNKVA